MPPFFELVSEAKFTFAHLERYPVWSEFYSYEERAEILRWGIDEAWLDQALAENHSGSNHALYPLLETNPFPERMRIYILARFKTPLGQALMGYIINEDAFPAICIFVQGKSFSFNCLLDDSEGDEAMALKKLLPLLNDPIFPLRFETDFTNALGKPIQGVFEL